MTIKIDENVIGKKVRCVYQHPYSTMSRTEVLGEIVEIHPNLTAVSVRYYRPPAEDSYITTWWYLDTSVEGYNGD